MAIGDGKNKTWEDIADVVGNFGDYVNVPYAPTADKMAEEGCLMFMNDGINEEINSSVGIDIYVLASSGEAKIRLDI